MNYSFLVPEENVSLPQPMVNNGLYGGSSANSSEWKKEYKVPERIAPDAIAYSSQFFELAKSHIPTGVRPGNNTIIDNKFVITDLKYNTLCFAK